MFGGLLATSSLAPVSTPARERTDLQRRIREASSAEEEVSPEKENVTPNPIHHLRSQLQQQKSEKRKRNGTQDRGGHGCCASRKKCGSGPEWRDEEEKSNRAHKSMQIFVKTLDLTVKTIALDVEASNTIEVSSRRSRTRRAFRLTSSA